MSGTEGPPDFSGCSSREAHLHALFLDVDGVLIDSLAVKGEAFVDVFSHVPNSREEVLAIHEAQGGVTRSVKLSLMHERLFGCPPDEDEMSQLLNRFGRTIEERVCLAPEIPGAEDMLRTWSSQCLVFAISATPDSELKRIMDARGLSRYFEGIFGWPHSKAQTLLTVIERYGFAKHLCIMVGDSVQDEEAAAVAQIPFLGISVQRPAEAGENSLWMQSWSDFPMLVRHAVGYRFPQCRDR